MNISSAVNYPSSGTSSYYPKNTVSTESQSDTVYTAGTEDPQVQAEKAKEQKAKDHKMEDQKNQDKQAEEHKLEKQTRYKKEDRIKETKQKDSDQFLQNQQKQNEESNEIASDMLVQNTYMQMGAQANLPITKDNYEEAVKHLAARGFQVKLEEDKLSISSKLHQLKLEISKQSYDQYVNTSHSSAPAEESADMRTESSTGSSTSVTGGYLSTGTYTPPATASPSHEAENDREGAMQPSRQPVTRTADESSEPAATSATPQAESTTSAPASTDTKSSPTASTSGNETATSGTKGTNNGKTTLIPGLL
ncbi:hypothetical protein [Paenibacillus shenyangensis]|uniref:hypothetical protein n=1 Tax=Paenibacillus sp. A9 TaxID=1284352 RepID=UPI0003638D3A|nr:hypothetical protein [Paenibacillus sp. A9]